MNVPAVSLAFASLGAILVWSRSGVFAHGFTDARLVCAAGGVLIAAHWHRWRWSPMVTPVLIYAISLLPALILTRSWAMSLGGYPGIYSGGVLAFILCAAGALLGEQLEDGTKAVKNAILAAGTVTVIVCLAQRAGIDPFRLGMVNGRAVGLLGSPVDVGALFVVLLTYAPPALVPAYLMGLWSTVSRGAWLGGLVALTPQGRPRAWAFAAALAVALGGVFFRPTPSDKARTAIWKGALESASSPWVGSGPATFNLTFRAQPPVFVSGEGWLNPAHAHNSVLDALSTKGVGGLLGLAAVAFYSTELLGFWLICLFNPVSFEVTFIACVLAGLARNPWMEA